MKPRIREHSSQTKRQFVIWACRMRLYPKRTLCSSVIFICLLGHVMSGLEWHPIPGGRYAEVEFDRATKAGFSLVDNAASGIRFTNVLSQDRHLTNQIYLNGSGVAAG